MGAPGPIDPPKALSPDVYSALQAAKAEILALRRQVAELAPKAEAYDVLRHTVAALAPQDRRGASVDTVWHIDQLLRDGDVHPV